METKPDCPDAEKPAEISSLGVLGARLSWVALGPVALLAVTWGIATRGGAWFTGLDALLCVIAGLMILARWVERRSGAATTLTGEPATIAQCKRYTLVLLVVAVVAWAVANLIGQHALT